MTRCTSNSRLRELFPFGTDLSVDLQHRLVNLSVGGVTEILRIQGKLAGQSSKSYAMTRWSRFRLFLVIYNKLTYVISGQIA